MATMFIRHTVADYAAWRRVYDGFDATRRGLGVTGDSVHQEADFPNDVTVLHHFASVEAARSFAQSTELRETMQNAGVASAPIVWFTR